jgi:aspartyl-tRNA(Asn)/glutamyl-tRNA(Gln) amidotransferase subunit A
MTESSRERVERALARIADPTLEGRRSCLTLYADAARAAADAADARAARGPLDGVVITIKDLFDVAGEVTRAGSPAWARRAQPAARDADVVQRLRAAGALIVAKTNMTEFAFSGVGANPHFGTPGNPADRTRIPGGSSSGGAVACADGVGALTIGTDTGGSTRIPAALCGLVGFKPTARRIPLRGVHPLSPTLDSVGPIAPSVALCFAADAVLAAEPFEPLPEVRLSERRIGFLQGLVLEGLDAQVASAYGQTLRKLTAAARCADVTPSALGLMLEVNERGGIVPAEAHATHRELLAEAPDEIDPNVRARILGAAAMTASDYIENLRVRARAVAQLDALFEDFDLLALPTTPIVAPTQDEVSTPHGFGTANRLLLRNTSVGNFFDLCAISLPMRCGQALPCGLMLFGRSGGDRALFAQATAVEALLNA